MKKIKLLLTFLLMGAAIPGFSKEIPGFSHKTAVSSTQENVEKVLSVCSVPSSSAQLDINNVRTVIYTGGDMWWDLNSNASYRIPKDGNATSLFAGSLWLGGIDGGGQLKVAAMTYRQNGVDFWPGPLDTFDVSVDQAVCNKYDQIFQISRAEVDAFVNENIPSSNITNWPGNGDFSSAGRQGKYLAPFHDESGDGIYDPADGDYPDFDLNTDGKDETTGKCKHKLYGDKALWWVFNDKGDIHSETGGMAMGVEIRAQAFAFKTDNEINDMTFYNYEIINRSSYTLGQTYFTVWNDADLGYYLDDLVGCDVGRGLGFIFNGDGNDEDGGGITGYHSTPPAIGCDFFQGPLADPGDGINNDHDSIFDSLTMAYTAPLIDEVGEQILMSGFYFYNNNIGSFSSATTNPSNGSQYYGYMTGHWRDGSHFTYGGTGYNSGVSANFMFPGNTDPTGIGTGNFIQAPWYSYLPPTGPAVDVPSDKRFLQSAGPFTLQPGAVNYVTFGMPWARTATQNSPWSSVQLLLAADDKAQSLFDNCFNVINGPDAPDLTIQELQNELLIYVSAKPSTNNYNESYEELDPNIKPPLTIPNLDNTYDFEGYIIYQLKDAGITENDLYNQDKARIVAQCDVKNGHSKLVNYEFDASVGAAVPKVKVEGADEGIAKSFKITSDKFSTGNSTLVNHKTYYYMAVSYAFNQYVEYKADQPPASLSDAAPNYYGQKLPFLRGRRNIKKYSGIPHIPKVEVAGTVQNSWYGLGPKITRIEGQGNGGNSLDLTDETVAQILSLDTGRVIQTVYANSRGPVKIKVIDPLNVPNGDFTFKFLAGNKNNTLIAGAVNESYNNDSMWVLEFSPAPGTSYNGATKFYSSKSIKVGNEQIIPETGLSVFIEQVNDPGDGNYSTATGQTQYPVKKEDFIEASMTFSDATQPWLSAIEDQDGNNNYANWIFSGNAIFSTTTTPSPWDDYHVTNSQVNYFSDPDQVWEGVLGGTWAPYRMCARSTFADPLLSAPAYEKPFVSLSNVSMRTMASVDIVITTDKNKWTRCPVLEECGISSSTFPAGIEKLSLRGDHSVNQNGDTLGSGGGKSDANFISATGMGWFPGYAINVETGERLNMAFGENSTLGVDNGRDMIWNPTPNQYDQAFNPVFGGMHYIYVFGHNADGVFSSSDALLPNLPRDVKRYDYGKSIYDLLRVNNSNKKAEVFKDAMWVNIPVLNPEYVNISKFRSNLEIPTDVKVRLRVKKPYRYALATHFSPTTTSMPITVNSSYLPSDTVKTNILNNNMPMYKFSTADIYTELNNSNAAVNALDLINIVPNPYFGYSSYEVSRLDNKVKITNLPENCKVRIYTLNGTLVRTYNKDSDLDRDGTSYRTSLDWDLKNQKGIPIASGLYIIHVDAPGIGEKIIKWFGVMRPFDLQSY
ncbi:MAG: hypothetical protein IAF38_07005 [Bacteroidia bacterium]|nr:hypothetical protein [Bacteroidia bacterium]